MIGRITIARWAVIGGVVLAVGAAGAASKLKRPATGDACLCTPDAQAPADLSAALDTAQTSSYRARLGGSQSGSSSSSAGALPPALQGGGDLVAHSNGATSSNAGGGGWAHGSGFTGANSSSGSGPSATLGGLWRLMSLSQRSPAATAAHAATIARREAANRSPRSAAARPPRNSSPGGGSSGGGPGAPAFAPAIPEVSDLFAEQVTSIPDLLAGGVPPRLTLPGGGSGPGGSGGGIDDPGALAATPEPASLLLLGTGLIGVAGLLRRRLA